MVPVHNYIMFILFSLHSQDWGLDIVFVSFYTSLLSLFSTTTALAKPEDEPIYLAFLCWCVPGFISYDNLLVYFWVQELKKRKVEMLIYLAVGFGDIL